MAAPDDGRMDLSDTVTIGNAVSARIAPAFVRASIGLGLVYAETCPNNTNVIKFPKSGSLVAEAVAEGQVYVASDANSDINDTSVTGTATKVMVASPISWEAQRFNSRFANIARVAEEQGAALARKYDVDLKALFNSVTAAATATSTLDSDTVLQAQFNIYDGLTPPGPLVAIVDFKGMYELRKLVANSGAAVYASQYNTVLFGTPAQNGFQGNYLGIDFYQTSGLSTTGGDDQGLLFDPRFTFCSAISGSIESKLQFTGMGVASQVPGVSDVVLSYWAYDIDLWNDAAACELRSDT